MNLSNIGSYRGRLAPSPTGLLHLGHARTFGIAAQRARENHGALILRNEDLDPQRCRADFADAMLEDLHWLGFRWSEGPVWSGLSYPLTPAGVPAPHVGEDCGGPYAPYSQSQRREYYLRAWRTLRDGGFIFPCTCSRKDLAQAATAPNDSDDEPIYPGHCRHRNDAANFATPAGVNWRFRVPQNEVIRFQDLHLGTQQFTAGSDFGDFVIWRRDDVPAYQLAVTVDDAAMAITEVVRGADLLKSTARQLLIYRALGLPTPQFYHCDLLRDEAGQRLAKRHDSLSIRHLRSQGQTPEQVLNAAYS